MFAIILALALQATMRPSHIEDQGWTYMGSSTDRSIVFFTRSGPSAKHIWSRFEVDQGRVRSYRQLDEVNCSTGQMKTLQQTSFTEPNLEGSSRVIPIVPEWRYPEPDTFAEMALYELCYPRAN